MSDLHALEDALDREAWLLWRRDGIGGSDAAIILGVARWGTPWTLFMDKKMGLTSRSDVGAQLTGKLLEDAVIKWATAETGSIGLKAEQIQHPDHEWMRGTPDHWLLRSGQKSGLEAKVAEWPWETPPEYYAIQCRWYMAIADVDEWILAGYFRKAPAWKLYRIERDLDIERDMIEKVGAWWQRHIVEGVAPPIDETAAAGLGLGRLHGPPKERDSFRVATVAEERTVREYAHHVDSIETLEAARDLMANHLRNAIGENAGIRFSGGKCRWSRSEKQPRGRLIVNLEEL